MQTPSGHFRCKKTQTPSRHEPKTAQTASQKTLSRHLWNNLKQPQSTIFGATEHMPSLCKHHLDTADAKRPKHHLDTSRKPAKTASQKTVSRYLWNPHKTNKSIHAQPMRNLAIWNTADAERPRTASGHKPESLEQPKHASQKTLSRQIWKPHT